MVELEKEREGKHTAKAGQNAARNSQKDGKRVLFEQFKLLVKRYRKADRRGRKQETNERRIFLVRRVVKIKNQQYRCGNDYRYEQGIENDVFQLLLYGKSYAVREQREKYGKENRALKKFMHLFSPPFEKA